MEVQWSKHPIIMKRLLELDAMNLLQAEMADIIYQEFPEILPDRPTRDQVKNALARAREKAPAITKKFIPDTMPYYNKYREQIEGREKVKKNDKLLSEILQLKKRKMFVISDIHVPFTDEVKLQRAIDLNRTADICIIAGDVMDMYGCSRHRKRKSVPHEVELDRTVRLFELLSETFPIVVVLHGNHDDRPIKKIRDVVPPELFYLFESGGPLELLSRPFSNVFFIDDWYFQIGDAVMAHAERSSTVEGRPAVMLAEFFLVKGWAKRLSMPDIRVVVQAHTHQVSAVYREGLKMLECGCMAEVMEYTLDSSAVMRPPMNGCVSIVQYDGISDFNQTREYVL